MSDTRKLGVPFLVVFLGALTTKLIEVYLSASFSDVVMKIVVVLFLCTFGFTLNGSRKHSHSVWKKVVAILGVVFLLFMQLDLFTFSSVGKVFSWFGVHSFYINMLYIYFGYMFGD